MTQNFRSIEFMPEIFIQSCKYILFINSVMSVIKHTDWGLFILMGTRWNTTNIRLAEVKFLILFKLNYIWHRRGQQFESAYTYQNLKRYIIRVLSENSSLKPFFNGYKTV